MNDEISDQEMNDVESLLRQMSLKGPAPHQVSKKPMLSKPLQNSVPLREFLIGLSCLFAGVFLGRMDLVPDATNEHLSGSRKVATLDGPRIGVDGEQASSAEEASSISNVQLIDKGLFLVNGKVPVRKYESVSQKKVMVVDPVSGQKKPVMIPVKEVFMMAAPCT